MQRTKKTDNDHFDEKVGLRVRAWNRAKNKRVLDCFHGNGMLWNRVADVVKTPVEVVGIEKIKTKGNALLRGEAIKHLPTLDLDAFGIIDLDDYGVPFDETKLILDRGWRGCLLVTLIQSQHGRLPLAMNTYFGMPPEMVNHVPSVFNGRCWEKFAGLLYDYGVRSVEMHEFGRKLYFLAEIA